MKKLLFLGPPFDYNKGGAEYQYKILEQYLMGKFDIYYLFRHPTSLHERNYINYDYRFRRSYNKNLYTDTLVIYRLIKRLSPDIIYKQGVNYITAVGVYYAKLHKISMVLHIASQRDVEKPKYQSGLKVILDLLDQKVAKYVIRNASQIICQAKYQKMRLQANYGRRCDLILPNFHPIPQNTIRKTLPIKIVWIANFKQLKQPELFIELAEIFKNNQNIKFIMIGKPASSAWQRSLYEKMNLLPNLDYRGELSIDEVNHVLSESHIFVNTSLYEGFPNTYIQAWMRRVPVVSLTVDPDNILVRERIGFRSGTLKRLCTDVRILIENKALREEMGTRACRFARANHNVEKIIEKVTELLE